MEINMRHHRLTSPSPPGLWQAITSQQTDSYHPIIGIILFGLVLTQPLGGLLHHGLMKKHGKRTLVSYVHICKHTSPSLPIPYLATTTLSPILLLPFPSKLALTPLLPSADLGRLLITLGMINGGLGLLLSSNASRGDYIAYGVVAGVIWVAYIAIAAFGEVKDHGKAKGGEKGEMEQGMREKEMPLSPRVSGSTVGGGEENGVDAHT